MARYIVGLTLPVLVAYLSQRPDLDDPDVGEIREGIPVHLWRQLPRSVEE
ncbi:hypothetical protein [Smaragdicoccus niigatensis]|nr:hypothetical protein [Smaragdicoccus niigatensis]